MSVVPSTNDGRPTAAELQSVYQGMFKLCPFTRSVDPSLAEVTIDGGRLLFTPPGPDESRTEDPKSNSTQLEEVLPRFLSAGNTDDGREREAKILSAISVLDYCEGVFQTTSEAGDQAEPGDTARDGFTQSERIQYLIAWPNAYIRDKPFAQPLPHIMNVQDSQNTSVSESGATRLERSRHIAWWSEDENWSVSFYSSMTSESRSTIGEEVESHPSTVIDWIVEFNTEFGLRPDAEDADTVPGWENPVPIHI